MAPTSFYGWKLVAAFWVVLFCNLAFPLYGSSVINGYMVADLGIDRRTLGIMFAAYMLLSGLPAPLVALMVNKLGVRLTLVSGSAVMIVGAAAMATLVSTGWHAVLAYGFLIGIGVLTGGPLAAQTGCAFWFVRRRALAIALILTAGGIGGFIAARTLNELIVATGDWRSGWWLIAALSCIALLTAFFFVKDKPADIGQVPDGGSTGAPGKPSVGDRPTFVTGEEWAFREALRAPVLWGMMLAGLGFSVGISQFLAHGVVHLKDLGNSADAAANAMSILVLSTLIGKLALGAFGDRIDPRFLWALANAFLGAGLIVAVDARSSFELHLLAGLIGAGFGGGMVCMMTTLSNYFGSRAYASVLGFGMAIQTTASAIGSSYAGDVFERTGTYAFAFHLTAGMCFAGAAILLFLKMPMKATRPAVS